MVHVETVTQVYNHELEHCTVFKAKYRSSKEWRLQQTHALSVLWCATPLCFMGDSARGESSEIIIPFKTTEFIAGSVCSLFFGIHTFLQIVWCYISESSPMQWLFTRKLYSFASKHVVLTKTMTTITKLYMQNTNFLLIITVVDIIMITIIIIT